jgi:lipopolysaccharide/colanic/teichoic acid biosynthesis glycosyltransferase
LKRLFDIIVSALGLLVLSPLLALLAILVTLRLGRPVFFAQRRPGLGGRLFTLYKFRTMTDARGPDGRLLPDAERLPPFGRCLRATSLDELPELWNILRGDMSFVGPRPLLECYLGRYNARQARRHEVRPGLTGWAQVNGRNALDWPARLELDVCYVEQRCFLLDLKILWMTLRAVLRREGISSATHATKEEFMGEVNGENR